MPRTYKRKPPFDPVKVSDTFVEMLRQSEHPPVSLRLREGVPVWIRRVVEQEGLCSSSSGWETLDR